MPGVPKIGGGLPGVPNGPVGPGLPNISGKPVPTKPIIKLERKLKPIHWTRVLIPSKMDPKKTEQIWDEIKELEIDQTEIEIQFEQKVIYHFL